MFIFKCASDSSLSFKDFKKLLAFWCAVTYLWLGNLFPTSSNWQYINTASFLQEFYFPTFNFLNLQFKLCRFYIQSRSRHVYSSSFISFLRPQSLSLSFPHLSLTPFVTSIYSALHLLQLTRENRRPFYLAHSASHLNCMLFRSIGFTVLYPNSFWIHSFF